MYLWSRRNPTVVINFLELIQFQAPYLPLFYLALDTLFIGTPLVTVVGYLVGHLYYFLEDVLPHLPGTEDFRLLKTPYALEKLCELLNFQPIIHGELEEEMRRVQEEEQAQVQNGRL